jgi:hypothetical protein
MLRATIASVSTWPSSSRRARTFRDDMCRYKATRSAMPTTCAQISR